MQLAGRNCAVCRRVIPGVREGQFCPTCSSPVHHDCAQRQHRGKDRCKECGAPAAAGRGVQREEEQLRQKLGRSLARQDIYRGLLAIVSGVVLGTMSLVLAIAHDIGGPMFIFSLLVVLGGAFMSVRGLRRLKRSNPDDYPESPEPGRD
ncbi:MAG: hypothetical protein ACJ8F7_12045 [Gemmataceae bacterium]